MGEYSGRFVLRVAPGLHARLRGRAREKGLSLNRLCERLIETGLETSAGPMAAPPPGLDPDLLAAVAREWGQDLVGIALFGSAARGEATASSDIDLLIVLATGREISRAHYDRWAAVLRSRGRRGDDRVSPQFVALPADASRAGGLWLEAAREAIILLDPSAQIARVLIALRDYLLSGAVVRRSVHGHPYWVRVGGES